MTSQVYATFYMMPLQWHFNKTRSKDFDGLPKWKSRTQKSRGSLKDFPDLEKLNRIFHDLKDLCEPVLVPCINLQTKCQTNGNLNLNDTTLFTGQVRV